MAWYYLNESGDVTGPISLETLKELIAAGALTDVSQVCQENTEDWITLAQALEADAPGGVTDAATEDEAGNTDGQISTNKSRMPKTALIAGLILILLIGSFLGFRKLSGSKDEPTITDPDSTLAERAPEGSTTTGTESPPSQTEPIVFLPPVVDRSPRDVNKGNRLSEDSRLAYNSLAWFMTEHGNLSQTEQGQLKEKLDRIDLLISSENTADYNAAAKLVDACLEEIPSLRQSANVYLAKILFLDCGGDRGEAGSDSRNPAWQTLGSDSIQYRVELMDRLGWEPSPMLEQIIASPESDRGLLVQALMERARPRIGFNGIEGARDDISAALRLSGETPSMLSWVEAEAQKLIASNPKISQ